MTESVRFPLKLKWASILQKFDKPYSFNRSNASIASGNISTAAINARADINQTTSKLEITSVLVKIGCQDLTERLDTSRCTKHPIVSGGLGDIYRGELNQGSAVAIKRVTVRSSGIETDGDCIQNVAHELYIWFQCNQPNHPNILDLLGFVELSSQIGMVSPWMENGALPEYLRANPSSDPCQLCIQVATGLAYLHHTKIVHGDIKGSNVLISDSGTARIADFGNACLLDCTRLPVHAYSLRWSAPEIWREGASYSCEADVYALAMTALEILTGEVPPTHTRRDVGMLFEVGTKQSIPSRPFDIIPTQSKQGNTLWSLLESCWSLNPSHRPDANRARDELASINLEGLVDEAPTSSECSTLFASLVGYGCPDLTERLDRARCRKIQAISDEPFSYRGMLRDGTQVSLRFLVPLVGPSHPSANAGIKSAAEELAMWSKCNHSNIIPLLGIATMGNQIVLVYSWARTTAVPSYQFRRLGANKCLLGLELAKGISYLHNRGLRGMDAKSVRVSENGKVALIACSNVIIDIHRNQLTHSRAGRRWKAPRLRSATGSYNSQDDVYDLGMMLFEIITQRELGTSQNPTEFPNTEHPTQPRQHIPSDSRYGDDLWRLLTQSWASDGNARPNAARVVEQVCLGSFLFSLLAAHIWKILKRI
ncbi:kinase-like protein [Ceratobasidium sp. AG-I]|nr:kinase-like protein [Ceratobasidium sp. AG-I]